MRKVEYGTSKIAKSFWINLQMTNEILHIKKPSEFDADFQRVDKNYQELQKALREICDAFIYYLQPKSKNRHHLAVESMSYTNILRKQAVIQSEEAFGSVLLSHGQNLGIDNMLGPSLARTGEVFLNIAKIKTERDYLIKSRFIGPVKQELITDAKEINKMRKKLRKQRIEFDAIHGKAKLVTTKIAKQKLDVMVEEVAARMSDFITRNRNKIVELYSAIGVLAEYQAEYRRLLEPLQDQIGKCVASADLSLPETINLNPMHTLDDTLNINTDSITLPQHINSRFSTPETVSDKNNKKKSGHGLLLNQLFVKNKSQPKINESPPKSMNQSFNESEYEYETVSTNPGNLQNQNQPVQILRHQYRNNLDDTFSTQDSIDPSKPSCIALYDFDAKNYGELSIYEGQKIDLLSQLDDEWYEGRVDGTIGYFPINYVKILVPLPK